MSSTHTHTHIEVKHPLTVAYGGGLNSVALMLEWRRRKMPKPDLILFADTGGEKPETYAYNRFFSEQLKSMDYPELITVANDGMYKTLENNALLTKTLPSLAYGWKSCSDKYKKRPQEKYIKHWEPAKAAWKAGSKVTKLIGIDAGEVRRATMTEDDHYVYHYPLVVWDIDRQGCIDIITAAGLPLPPKSSCFFCPAMKKPEILELAEKNPELFARAVAMERNAAATNTTTKGLGRRFSWEQFVESKRLSLPLVEDKTVPEIADTACMCYDGDASCNVNQ